VQEAFPDSKVTANGTNNYPIKVIVTAEYGGQKTEIWSGRQQSLFRKNGKQRDQSIAEIKRNLNDYKEDVIGS